jgi:hypothetical protein
MKTAKQIQGDIIALLKDSALAGAVNGRVYHFGYRPRDSKAEDIIVYFSTGLQEQIEKGVVGVLIYVPDIGNPDNGVLQEDGRRCEELEIAAAAWVDSLTADKTEYRFKLQQTIYTEAEPEIDQHFVVVKLKYELFETGRNR